MTGPDFGNLAYLVLLLILVGGYVATRRRNMRQTLRHVSSWAVIFTMAIVGASLWSDIRSDLPHQATYTASGRIEVPRAADGHYYVTLDVDGTPVNFIVDTGATDIVLSQRDARRVGFDEAALYYTGRAGTANGEVRTAAVRLDELSFGPLTDLNVPAQVNGGDMAMSLLGMSYLRRFERIEITGGRLVLER